jgi:hypothetical protein
MCALWLCPGVLHYKAVSSTAVERAQHYLLVLQRCRPFSTTASLQQYQQLQYQQRLLHFRWVVSFCSAVLTLAVSMYAFEQLLECTVRPAIH